jgi:hypothetical protein
MVVIVINYAAAVDAANTIPSPASMVAAKTPLPPPPSTAASIDHDCYCRHQQLPSLLPYIGQLMAAVVFIGGDSEGEGRRGQGRTWA